MNTPRPFSSQGLWYAYILCVCIPHTYNLHTLSICTHGHIAHDFLHQQGRGESHLLTSSPDHTHEALAHSSQSTSFRSFKLLILSKWKQNRHYTPRETHDFASQHRLSCI